MILKSAHKRIFAGFIFLLLCNAVPAQELSVQIATGLMNYGGDLQNKVYTFKQAQF